MWVVSWWLQSGREDWNSLTFRCKLWILYDSVTPSRMRKLKLCKGIFRLKPNHFNDSNKDEKTETCSVYFEMPACLGGFKFQSWFNESVKDEKIEGCHPTSKGIRISLDSMTLKRTRILKYRIQNRVPCVLNRNSMTLKKTRILQPT